MDSLKVAEPWFNPFRVESESFLLPWVSLRAAALTHGYSHWSPYSIRVPNDSKKDMEIVVAAFLSFLLLFSFFQGPVHAVEIRACRLV